MLKIGELGDRTCFICVVKKSFWKREIWVTDL